MELTFYHVSWSLDISMIIESVNCTARYVVWPSVHRRLGIHKFYSPVAKLEFSKSYTRNFNPFQNYSSDRIYETAYVCADIEKEVILSSIPDVNIHFSNGGNACNRSIEQDVTDLLLSLHCLNVQDVRIPSAFLLFYLDHLPDICQRLLSLSTFILLISSLWTFLTTSLNSQHVL